jgi:hypothetical protein
MRRWLERVRPIVGIGLTWAVAWAPVGLLMGWLFGGNSVVPDEFPLDDWLTPFMLFGFLGGATFSLVLRLASGRRTFDELSLPRFGAWGALGGVIAGVLAVLKWQFDPGWGPVLWENAIILIGSTTLLAAISASGSLAIARRAEAPALLDAGEDVDHAGLSEDEKRELLGGA